MLFCLTLPLAAAVAPPPIVNGQKTDDFPDVLLLRHTTADGRVAFVCTGTLIAPDVALTAAHCLTPVEDYDLTDVRAFSGAVWSEGAPEHLARDWLIHPDYRVEGSTIEADLGLVFLDDPYEMEGHILNQDPITEADVGDSFRYVGWGASGDAAGDSGYYKRVAEIPLSGLETEFMLGYDGEAGSATCGGDSGGPVFELGGGLTGALAGVHSFGRDDDGTICAGSVSGDTRVDLYVDWIVGEAGARTDAAPEEAPTEDTGRTNRPDGGDDPGGCATAGGPSGLAAPGLAVVIAGSFFRVRRRGSSRPSPRGPRRSA